MGTPGEAKPVKLSLSHCSPAIKSFFRRSKAISARFSGPSNRPARIFPGRSATTTREKWASDFSGALFLSALWSRRTRSLKSNSKRQVSNKANGAPPTAGAESISIRATWMRAKSFWRRRKAALTESIRGPAFTARLLCSTTRGSFHPFVYTYRDYAWPETAAFLAAARSRYLDQLRQNAEGLL